ncbi:branched-chain amino acid ABC transporter, periplasmic branched-chain amino acid-binding protein, putative [Roseovarius sp. 217]|jgi:branched-chain amino acid transport system substrate-binding protein|nr:branched-chain amino acid ABC transporter, periplasmic branched-chain amino acid-binding protein, putative [Roseovarius sp. 217]
MISRRTALKLTAGGAAMGLAAPALSQGLSDKLLIGVPSSLSTPYGVADDTDHLNGTNLALEEINSSGGILGREIELFVPDVDKLSPESCRQAIAACIDKKVHAISNSFLFAPIPAMDESAKYKCPYLNGNTQRAATEMYRSDPEKYSHILQTDPSEVNYGWTYPKWLEKMEESGVWTPKNRKIHIVAEQVGYCQTILKAAREAIPNSTFELVEVTDIQYPVNDWGPVIQKLKEVDAGAIMINHWVAAEYAAFCKQFSADPVENSLVYLQYGPSQPEFLELGRSATEGFCWSTVLGVYGDQNGQDFRKKYLTRYPEFEGNMGLVYTGNGYDIMNYLKLAWEATGDPDDFAANVAWIRNNPYRGVNGMMNMNNDLQEALHFPDNGFGNQAANLEDGMGQLFVQVQDREHKVIWPNEIAESTLRPAPWWT